MSDHRELAACLGFGGEHRRPVRVTRLGQPHRDARRRRWRRRRATRRLVGPGASRARAAAEHRRPPGWRRSPPHPACSPASPTTTISRRAGGWLDSQPRPGQPAVERIGGDQRSASSGPARSSAIAAATAAAAPTAPSTDDGPDRASRPRGFARPVTSSGPADASTAATTVTSRTASSQGSRRRRRRRRRGVVGAIDAQARHDDAGHRGAREQVDGDRNGQQHEARQGRRGEPVDAHDQPRCRRAIRKPAQLRHQRRVGDEAMAAQPRPVQSGVERPVVRVGGRARQRRRAARRRRRLSTSPVSASSSSTTAPAGSRRSPGRGHVQRRPRRARWRRRAAAPRGIRHRPSRPRARPRSDGRRSVRDRARTRRDGGTSPAAPMAPALRSARGRDGRRPPVRATSRRRGRARRGPTVSPCSTSSVTSAAAVSRATSNFDGWPARGPRPSIGWRRRRPAPASCEVSARSREYEPVAPRRSLPVDLRGVVALPIRPARPRPRDRRRPAVGRAARVEARPPARPRPRSRDRGPPQSSGRRWSSGATTAGFGARRADRARRPGRPARRARR